MRCTLFWEPGLVERRLRPDDSVGLTAVRASSSQSDCRFQGAQLFPMPSGCAQPCQNPNGRALALLERSGSALAGLHQLIVLGVAGTNRACPGSSVGIASNGTASRRRIRRFDQASSPTPLALQICRSALPSLPCASGAVRQRCSLDHADGVPWAGPPASLLSVPCRHEACVAANHKDISGQHLCRSVPAPPAQSRVFWGGLAVDRAGVQCSSVAWRPTRMLPAAANGVRMVCSKELLLLWLFTGRGRMWLIVGYHCTLCCWEGGDIGGSISIEAITTPTLLHSALGGAPVHSRILLHSAVGGGLRLFYPNSSLATSSCVAGHARVSSANSLIAALLSASACCATVTGGRVIE